MWEHRCLNSEHSADLNTKELKSNLEWKNNDNISSLNFGGPVCRLCLTLLGGWIFKCRDPWVTSGVEDSIFLSPWSFWSWGGRDGDELVSAWVWLKVVQGCSDSHVLGKQRLRECDVSRILCVWGGGRHHQGLSPGLFTKLPHQHSPPTPANKTKKLFETV